jgi:hypothetical protein
VEILDLLKGSPSLAEVDWCDGENESSTHSTALNSVYPEHLWFVLSGGLLGNTNPQTPRVDCILLLFHTYSTEIWRERFAKGYAWYRSIKNMNMEKDQEAGAVKGWSQVSPQK